MRRLLPAASIGAATLALALFTATDTYAQTQAEAIDCSKLQPSADVTGTLYKCPWDDGRIRVFGTLKDTSLSDGATILKVTIGAYSQQWTICDTDTPVDTDYRDGSVATFAWLSTSADRC
ncbi:hypothetical protein [Streptomyces sp. NPDC090994]|uniref:hypothetical protein n=1 Tax=Streptomyces sp. NPDC090994 TaxID=3365969 RepID=UPI0037F7C382